MSGCEYVLVQLCLASINLATSVLHSASHGRASGIDSLLVMLL